MRPLIPVAFLLLFTSSCSSVRETGKPVADDSVFDRFGLQRELHSILSGDLVRYSTPAIVIYMPDYDDTIFHYNGDALLRPASNQKLLTSLAALYTLGAYYNFRTILYRDGPVEDGVLKGNLIIKGFGNPLLSVNDLLDLIESLKEFGIRKIEGSVFVDESFFDTERWPPGWMSNFDPAYFAPYISALAVMRNSIAVHIAYDSSRTEEVSVSLDPPTSYVTINREGNAHDSGYVPLRFSRTNGPTSNIFDMSGHLSTASLPQTFHLSVQDPALYTGTLLSEMLALRGITDSVKVLKTEDHPHQAPLIQINTPIDTVIQVLNKQSDNLIGEMLLKVISAELNGTYGSRAEGAQIVEKVLRLHKIILSPIRISDGSGLSYYNLLTGFTIAQLLTEARRNTVTFPILYESLSRMGVDGTLRNRLKSSIAKDKFRGKTGTLGRISSLSGYGLTEDDETVICVLLFQNFTGDSTEIRKVQDDIIELLIKLRYNK
jgi:serine-type D-Ala-D-Ala carboxypeptidase/endopeptidase (penicillin-binding protein 4)